MGVRFPFLGSTTVVTASIPGTAETVVCTTPPFTPSLDFAQVLIMCYSEFNTGTGVTSVVGRIRRGTTASGVALGTASPTLVIGAATPGILTFFYLDVPGAVAGQQYSFTMTMNGATGASGINDVCMALIAL
jgi:hypothetical protein